MTYYYNNVLLFSAINFNISIVFRMLQGQSPLKIRLDRIRNYDAPFASSIKSMKIGFLLLGMYMGIPMSFIEHKIMGAFYLCYWFLCIWWWRYFSLCDFRRCMYISGVSLIGVSICVYFHPLYVPAMWWSAYTLYLSYWYHKSYVNTNFIFS